MSLAAGLGLIGFSIALLLGAMGGVRLLAQRFDLAPELQRKLVHISTGLYALTLPLTFRDRWPVVVLILASIAVMLALRLPQFSRSGLASTLHAVERKSYGEIYLSCAVGFLFFQSQGQPILYVLPILTLTLSDAAAALIGTSYGGKRFPVEGGVKSVEGVIAFFVVTWLLAMVLLLTMTDAPRVAVIVLGLLVAAFGALVEADSWRGLDNLFVPLSIHFLLAGNLNAPILNLVLLTVTFIGAIAAIRTAAPALRLSNHAARAYTILIFLVCSIALPKDAILPVVAILAHLVAQRVRPCDSAYPDLDLLATIAGISLFWLFIGRYFGHSAIDLFDLTFAAMAAALLSLALGQGRWWLLIPAFATLLAMVLRLTGWSQDEVAWHGLFWPWAAASLALSMAVPLSRPAWFDRFRSPRVLATAATLPIVLFIAKGILV
jgi:dolichol kinase